jgi:riboflavin biosynthesis pyrimidine reductase
MTKRSEGLPLEPIWPSSAQEVQIRESTHPGWRGGELPPALAGRYRGELAIALRPTRPAIVANFVTSIDGVVALGPTEPSAGGGEISGFSDADRFMMALLRSLADVVVVGAGTVRAGRNHEWTPRRVQPDLAAEFAAWRERLGLSPQPTTIVVTARGDVDLDHRGLKAPDVPVIVATTSSGARRLAAGQLPPNLQVVVAGNGDSVSPSALLEVITAAGANVALCEGGPHLFGDLLGAGLVDELFLTLAPQVVGRTELVRRFGLVEGTTFIGGEGRWAHLVSIRRAGDDLFLRYGFDR